MKKGFKSQASSGRVGNGFGGFGVSAFGSSQSSVLSYIQEPLDYSGISDANVVVAFKNLSKKDATTKAKALEDLSATIAGSDFEIEDGLLEAWVKLFPRLSIDSSRRVRQLAHTLNGQICSKSGKRTAKHMARIAGPWLAGAYDGDRAAAKAAQESLNVVFTDPKKLHGVRKAFQQAILEYCSEALLHETVQTLSDERTVSADDAQATFARVMATSLSLVNSLLDDLTADDIAPQQKLYEQLIEGKIWEYAVHSDTGVRRSMHRLVRAYLSKQPENLASHLKAASTAYIYKGLPSDQTGSSLDFMHTLDQLTGAHPNLWTEYYSGKKSAVSRLRSCLKHGSQAGPEQYWTALGSLVRKLPEEVLPTTYDEVADLLSGARDGASKREDRFNASHSWQTYATIADTSSRLLSEQDQDKLMENRVLPIVKQYLQQSPDTSDWGISGARGAWIVSKVAQIHRLPTILERELPSLADQLIEQVKISQPEQSKDYEKSQKEAASAGERWSALQREILNGGYDTPDSLRAVFVSQDTRIIKECLTLLKTRTGKPYGAAAVVDELLRVSGELLLDDAELKPTLASFAENDLPDLLFTPSQRHLTHCLYALESDGSFEKVFSAVLQRLVKDEAEPSSKERLLKVLFTRQTLEEATRIAQHSSDFQKLLASLTAPDEHGKVPFPGLLADMLCVGVVHSDTASSIVGSLTKQLAEEGTASDALQSLDYLASSSTAAGSQYLADPTAGGNTLLSNVIRLEQSQDDKVAELASKLSSKLSLSSGSNGSLDKFSIVRQNLDTISGSSIPIDTLHALVGRLAGSNGKLEDGAKAIPQLDNWWSALQSAMAPPSPSLSLLSPYGGAVYLVSGDKEPEFNTPHDAQGLSQALRVAMYIVRLLASTDVLVHLRNPTNEGDDTLSTIVALLVTTVVVAEDNMSIPRTNALWQPNAELDGEVLDFISEANAGITKVLADSSSSDSVAYQASFDRLLGHSSKAQSSATYYAALASSRLSSNLFETHGSSAESAKAGEDTIRGLRKSSDLFGLLRQLVGYAHPLSGSQYLNRVCNELVADLTGLDVAKSEERALRELVTLNVILNSQEDIVEAIAKQRLIFLVKHVIPWLEAGVDPAIKAEVAKALTALLPSMQDIYGEHWAQILTLVSQSWSALDAESIGETSIPLEYATLRLHGALRKLAKSQDANDDLVDALKDQDEQISEGLLNLLKATNGVSDESHQPLMLMNELLARQLTQLPARKLKHVDQLYSLLYTSSHAIQQAAFDLLHSQVPAGQEQISFDAALENKTAQLPDELLSLILDAPTLDSLAEASFDRSMPLSLQGYLYSWRLLFDHFNGSSYKVKSDYVEQLKDGTYLSGLLSLTFDFLGHTRGKSVDASRFNVADYQPNVEESPERDVQWLLTHLFYLSLTHLPSLTKSYYLDIRSRQTSLAVESWAAKFISPPIISASLQAVSEWSEKSVNEDPEYEKMAVKVGMRSKEINVSYVVDEQIMAIKVVLPEAYPLESAKVVGVSRVAVKEEKWQSWLRNCQGVITFSNGSITDGLSAWRKNVTGALKGQTECAICYSIISGDKQLPTKRCPTCKNLFHASCLYKWFRTSNASTCPLCRNAFNFN